MMNSPVYSTFHSVPPAENCSTSSSQAPHLEVILILPFQLLSPSHWQIWLSQMSKYAQEMTKSLRLYLSLLGHSH